MYAISAETGEELWRFETGGPIGSTPVAANGLLYFTSEDGTLYALE